MRRSGRFTTALPWSANGSGKANYVQQFNINPARTVVLRNAIAPCFANLFPPSASILAHKSHPPILAYTSIPLKGLHVLLDVFPAIRQAVPGVRLQVFSSLKVYQIPQEKDQAKFGDLYKRCRETQGIEYFGSIAQPELAKYLTRATLLAYPNVFPETSAIAVMEAMASGCRILTTRLGALSETTEGYATLIPPMEREPYLAQFVEQAVALLRETVDRPLNVDIQLRSQVDTMNSCHTWPIRAQEWSRWLSGLGALPPTTVKLETGNPSFPTPSANQDPSETPEIPDTPETHDFHSGPP